MELLNREMWLTNVQPGYVLENSSSRRIPSWSDLRVHVVNCTFE